MYRKLGLEAGSVLEVVWVRAAVVPIYAVVQCSVCLADGELLVAQLRGHGIDFCLCHVLLLRPRPFAVSLLPW